MAETILIPTHLCARIRRALADVRMWRHLNDPEGETEATNRLNALLDQLPRPQETT